MLKTKILAALNTLAFFATIVVNTLAVSLPLNGKSTGELSDMYPNLFVPVGLTFSIWGVIYLLLLFFIIYQLFIAFGKSDDKPLVNKISIWFLLSSIANCSWIFAWHYMLPGLALVIMLILLFSLIKIYLVLNNIEFTSVYLKYLIQPCFSIYLGWITVATIANTTAVLVGLGWDGGSIGQVGWTIIMISVATIMGIYFTLIKKDLPYTLVILWALYGIYLKQNADVEVIPGILLILQIGMIICVILILFLFIKKLISKNQ